tara:strand:- start:1214 stop:1672 length:459 start_codon:yes stop_codon:yes gene_type:complete
MVNEKIISQIETWINKILDVPNSKFGDLPPCPYARKAWVDGNVSVHMWEDAKSFEADEWDKQVHIYVFDDMMDPHTLSELACEYNNKYPEFLFLEEHPELVEDVDGFICNEGELILLIVQGRKHLEDAREVLKKTNYYDKWTPEMKERIIDR